MTIIFSILTKGSLHGSYKSKVSENNLRLLLRSTFKSPNSCLSPRLRLGCAMSIGGIGHQVANFKTFHSFLIYNYALCLWCLNLKFVIGKYGAINTGVPQPSPPFTLLCYLMREHLIVTVVKNRF